MKATAFDLQRTYRDEWQLVSTLTTDSVQEAMRLVDTANGKTYELTAKIYRKARSIPANAYFHKLCNSLASVLGVSDDEMKVHLVLKYGTVAEKDGVPVTITLPKAVDVQEFYRYAKWIEGDEYTDTYLLYKQTHTLDGSEFSRLISGTVEDCAELGIETLPPAELEAMYAQADKAHQHPAEVEAACLGA